MQNQLDARKVFSKYIGSNTEILSHRVKLFKSVIMYFDEDKYKVEKILVFFKFHHNK